MDPAEPLTIDAVLGWTTSWQSHFRGMARQGVEPHRLFWLPSSAVISRQRNRPER